jgi:gamma-glutamyltranspeptidase / glutathione hydrolase
MAGAMTKTEWKISCVEPVAPHAMVAAKHPLAVQAGVRVLEEGGNAIDAAVTTAFAMNVLDPAMNGIGGGGFMLYYDAAAKQTHLVDYFMTAPSAARPDMYEIVDRGKTDTLGYRGVRNDENTYGPRAVGVPGMAAGLAQALEIFGTISLDKALSPAIRFAEEGYAATWYSMLTAGRFMEILARHPETAKTFLKEGKFIFRTGGNGPADNIVQAELSRTLRQIAANGPDGFYIGQPAELIGAQLSAQGGALSQADLREYHTRTPAARSIRYRDRYEIIFAPATGGGTLAEVFNILEGYDFRGMDPRSVTALQPFIEACRVAYADRWQYLADENCTDVPWQLLESKSYAESRRRQIPDGRAVETVTSWDRATANPASAEPLGGHTTHLSVVDPNGNMVAITQTINMVWGSGWTAAGTGVLMNDAMVLFDPQPGRANSISPGKRPLSSMTPILVLRDGKPFMTVGAPGGRLIMGTVIRVVHNVLDFGMSVQDACDNIFLDVMGDKVLIDSALGAETLGKLQSMGYKLDIASRSYVPHIFASPTGILIDEQGQKHGGVDPYHIGIAAGY